MRNIPFHLSEALSKVAENPDALPAPRIRNLVLFVLTVVAVVVIVGAAAWFLL